MATANGMGVYAALYILLLEVGTLIDAQEWTVTVSPFVKQGLSFLNCVKMTSIKNLHPAESGVEIAARSGRFYVAFADGEIAKAFALLSLAGILMDNRAQFVDDLLMGYRFAIKLI